jgi:HSP20 family protein
LLLEPILFVFTLKYIERKIQREEVHHMLTRLDPLRGVASLRQAMDDLFEQSLVRHGWQEALPEALAPMDVEENDQGYLVRLSVPGFNAEDLDVIVQQSTLTIRGRVRQEDVERKRLGNLVRREIRMQAFERSVVFDRPIDTDRISSSYENGILTLNIPASEEARSRRIPIAGGQQAQAMGAGQGAQAEQGAQLGQGAQTEQGGQSRQP